MERARTHEGDRGAAGQASAEAAVSLELLVHGVGGTTPEEMLDDTRTVRITGDDTAAVYRRADDVDAERHPGDRPGRPVPEAYVWCNLTSGNAARALWLLLLPFMVVNLAHWMRPTTTDRRTAVRLYGLIVRLIGLTLTVLLVAAACEVAMDLAAWQCAGTHACARRHAWLGFLSPAGPEPGWWSQPGRRLALAALVPTALTGLLWYLSHRTWSAYESQEPIPRPPEPDEEPHRPALGRPGFWYGRRLVARLRAAHTAAGLLTVAAALTGSAVHEDRRHGATAMHSLGLLLEATLATVAVLVVAVVCRRGRTENLLDRQLDRAVVRLLPAGALALVVAAMVYAGWSRPGRRSQGRLPGASTFGALTPAQLLLVLALGVVSLLLYRAHPDSRTAMRGLAGPAVALLACALGGVMSGGVAQRVADWLDGTGHSLAGPPVLLTWQASTIPPLLLVLLVLAGRLARHTWLLRRAEAAEVERDYPGEPTDTARTLRIAGTRAMATLTDRAPLVVGVTSATTLLLGAAALVGAFATDDTPAGAVHAAQPVVRGAAETAQTLGSWLIGVGFLVFVTWGRRAYKDASARRTIGILWDVGTFWPRAAHPFAPPCYAERAVPDLTWRMATWTRRTGGRIVLSGHSQGSVLAAAAAWQLKPSVRSRVGLLTYGSPLERLYGRWFPAYFGPAALSSLHREVDCWRNLHRLTDPIGGPIRLPGDCGPQVDRAPLKDPLAYGRTPRHPLPAPILGHGHYQADPAFAEERARLLARLRPKLPGPRPAGSPPEPGGEPGSPPPGPDGPPGPGKPPEPGRATRGGGASGPGDEGFGGTAQGSSGRSSG